MVSGVFSTIGNWFGGDDDDKNATTTTGTTKKALTGVVASTMLGTAIAVPTPTQTLNVPKPQKTQSQLEYERLSAGFKTAQVHQKINVVVHNPASDLDVAKAISKAMHSNTSLKDEDI